MADIFSATYQNPKNISRSDRDFKEDLDFIKASKVLYELNKGKSAEPLRFDEDYAEYGLEYMGWFNHNVTKMAMDAERVRNVNPEQANAFLYLLDATEDLGMSWSGTGRFLKGNFGFSWEHGAFPDPLNYLGLVTGPFTTAAGFSAKQASKEGLRQLLKQSILKGGVVGSAYGATYTGVDSVARQSVRGAVSGEPISKYKVAQDSAIGAAGGFILGGASTTVGAKVSNYIDAKKAPKLVAEAKKVENDLIVKINSPSKALAEVAEEATSEPSTGLRHVTSSLDDLIKALKQTAPTNKPDIVIDGDDISLLERTSNLGITEEGTQSYKSLSEAVAHLKPLLAETAEGHPSELVSRIVDSELTLAQTNALKAVTFDTINALKAKKATYIELQKTASGDEAKLLYNERALLEDVIDTVGRLDKELSTDSGRALGYRAGGLNTGEMRNLENASDEEFLALYNEWLKKVDLDPEINEMKEAARKAKEAGDYDKFVKLEDQREQLQKEFVTKNLGVAPKLYDKFNNVVKAANEVAIGNVFSPKTLQLNMISPVVATFTNPLLNNLARDGLSAMSRRAIAAEYKAMWDFRDMAFNAAKASFKYERSILTGDSARFLEQYNILPKSLKAKGVNVPVAHVTRFFPRLLLATDTFFEQLHYRSFTVGRAMTDAYEDGIQKGVKDLDKHVKDATKKVLDDAYTPELNIVDLLRADGKSRGLTGEKLTNFIKTEMAEREGKFSQITQPNLNKDLLQKANIGKDVDPEVSKFNQQSKDYVDDILFKRDFSGKSTVSKAAKFYEQQINKHPIFRFMGQMFFRTPVRVFETAQRLTPFWNFMSPSFMNDLKGKNGTIKQMRAQREAMLSYALTANILMLYSNGKLTAAGTSERDFRKRRQLEDSKQFESYSIDLGDGETWSYRNADPFSTPVKILVNTFEKMEEIGYREAQGENVAESEKERAFNMMVAATGSLMQSIHDANLTQGISEIYDVITNVTDEKGYDRMIKYFGQKLKVTMPSTWYKLQLYENPELADPKSIEQYWIQLVNPGSPKVPKQYTAVGRPREIANVDTTLNMFTTTSPEQRKGDLPEKELAVNAYIAKLGMSANKAFIAPYKHALLPIEDLRLTPVTTPREGRKGDEFIGESIYDRWMHYTLTKTDVVERLYRESQKDRAWGTESVDGPAVKRVADILSRAREKALRIVIREEKLTAARKEARSIKRDKEKGEYDVKNTPTNITGTR